jgi:hypothetical protein
VKRLALTGGAVAAAIAVGFVLADRRLGEGEPHSSSSVPKASQSETAPPAAGGSGTDAQGFLYGRVTTRSGEVYLGRLRWAGNREAFWGDSFNGLKAENPWAAQVPPGRLPKEDRSVSILGLHFGDAAHPQDLRRQFMARFGDLARIEARGTNVVRVTLKSGSAIDLDHLEAGDFDGGVRVFDARGTVVLDSPVIASVELLPTTGLTDAPARLSGTVHTAQGDFTGYLQWDREKGLATDALVGRRKIAIPGLETAVIPGLGRTGTVSLRFDTIRTIARRARNAALVTLLDGREFELIGTGDSGVGDVGIDNRGIYVDDPRYGRVLVPWDSFESADLRPAGSGPAYADFPAGSAIAGTVTTLDGRSLQGRLIFDLDEAETTETLDAPAGGVNYLIPFGLVASITPAPPATAVARATVPLRSGEELAREPSGDHGANNAGVLVLAGGAQPEYVAWSEVARIDLERPAAQVRP